MCVCVCARALHEGEPGLKHCSIDGINFCAVVLKTVLDSPFIHTSLTQSSAKRLHCMGFV